MQDTVKMNYVQYGKSTKNKKGKKSTQSGASWGNHRGERGHGTSSKPSGKGKKLPFPQDTCYRCGKHRHQKTQDCKALDAVCRGCGKKGHFDKVCLKKCSTHSLKVPQASTSSAGAGAGEPCYFDDDGQPVFAHMVNVPHPNRHLIKFPIALDYTTLRSQIGNSNTPPQTMLLKADTVQEDWLGTKDEIGSSNVYLNNSKLHLNLVPQGISWSWHQNCKRCPSTSLYEFGFV